jgi:hypothetical protein
MTSGVYGMVKASLVFLATPVAAIGLALAVGVVVGAFSHDSFLIYRSWFTKLAK